MSGWGSLLSIYESVLDAATGETILVRRPSGTARSSTAAPSPFNSVGAPAAAGAPPSFGSTPVPAAVASLFGGGSMSNPAFGAVTTPSFQFRAAAPAASPFGAAAPAAGGLFSPAPATPLGGAALFAAGQAGTWQPQFQIHIEDETGLLRREVYHSITKMPAYQVRTPNPSRSPNPTLTPARPNHNPCPEPRP